MSKILSALPRGQTTLIASASFILRGAKRRRIDHSGGRFFPREKDTADLAEEARNWALVAEHWK